MSVNVLYADADELSLSSIVTEKSTRVSSGYGHAPTQEGSSQGSTSSILLSRSAVFFWPGQSWLGYGPAIEKPTFH